MYRSELLKCLDFVVETEEGLDFWKDVFVDDWAAGNAIGRERAAQTIRYMQEHYDPNMIHRIGLAVIGKPVCKSVLVGFNTGLSTALIRMK